MQHKVEFSSREYERSHMKQPRGFGSWAFGVNNPNPDVSGPDCLFSPAMTLTNAKRWATEQVRENLDDSVRQYVLLYVLP